MSSAESSIQPNFFRRVSTPVFLFLALLLVPAGTFVSLTVGILVCIIAGIENADAQARIGLAALLIGLVGSIYLIVRARRPTESKMQQAQMAESTPSVLPVVQAQNGNNQSEGADELGEYEDDLPAIETHQDQSRMIDWLQCAKLPVMLAAFGTILIVYAIKSPEVRALAIIVIPIAIALLGLGLFALVTQLSGFLFNGREDSLSYPLTVFRRQVQISDIRDANCQTITKPAFHITNTIIGLVSVGQVKGLGTTKRYIVNMSGEFGARRVIFHTKYKRDQFLSLLRSFAPHVRITRWV